MKRMKIFKHIFAFLIMICLVSPIFPIFTVFAASYSDISGHWARVAIERWSEREILKGNDGKFRPDDPVTRGELATILNRLFVFPESNAPLFTDISGKWYEKDINALAWQEVYIEKHGEANGEAKMTREEAVYMFVRAFFVDEIADSFADGLIPKDYKDIDEKYIKHIALMVNYGFINGMPDGGFHPKDNLTRAQVVTILDNLIETYIDSFETEKLYLNTKTGKVDKPLGKRVFLKTYGITLENQDIDYLFAPMPYPYNGAISISSKGGHIRSIYARFSGVSYYSEEDNAQIDKLIVKPIREPYDERFAGGFGLGSAPYIIENQTQLELLNEHDSIYGCIEHFRLKNDIILTGEWEPLNNGTYTLDGGGHTISGMRINKKTGNLYRGIAFGFFKSFTGTIKNLNLSGNINIEGGLIYAGAFSGQVLLLDDNRLRLFNENHLNKIINCTADITMNIQGSNVYAGSVTGYAAEGSEITDCTSTADIEITTAGKNAFAGGIAGQAEGIGTIIKNCASASRISMEDTGTRDDSSGNAGGIAGFIADGVEIAGCTSNATITVTGRRSIGGGIVGTAGNAGTIIKNCTSASRISVKDTSVAGYSDGHAGGIAGYIAKGVKIVDCTADTAITATGKMSYAGGISGFAGGDETMIKNCRSTGSISVDDALRTDDLGTSAGGIVGGLYNTARVIECYSDASVYASGGYGAYAGGIAGEVNVLNTDEKRKQYKEDADYRERIDNFISIKDCMSKGKVHAENSSMRNNAGGIAGLIAGTVILNSCSYSEVSASGNPDWYNFVGGLAGGMYDYDDKTKNSKIYNSYSAGTVKGGRNTYIGGITGRVDGELTNCYTLTKITAPYSLNDYTVNGLVGSVWGNGGLTTKNCGVFNVAQPHFVSGNEYMPEITNVALEDLKNESAYKPFGWDFENVWKIQSDKYNFPILRGKFEKEQIETALAENK